jgi:hypothetical protein
MGESPAGDCSELARIIGIESEHWAECPLKSSAPSRATNVIESLPDTIRSKSPSSSGSHGTDQAYNPEVHDDAGIVVFQLLKPLGGVVTRLSQAEPEMNVAAARKHALVSSNAVRTIVGSIDFIDSIFQVSPLADKSNIAAASWRMAAQQ